MPSKQSCVVVTCFAEGQPGFLDFSYRLKALGRAYRLTVVSSAPLSEPELQIPGAEYVVITSGPGRSGWLRYLWQCGRLLRSRIPDVAVLLHSAAAPVALFAGSVPTVTYWNEHPTHFAPVPGGFAPVKRLTRLFIRWLFFQGARRSTLLMPIGEAHHEDVLQHGCDPKRVRLQYMGVDTAFHRVALINHGAGREDVPLHLLYVGSVGKSRGRDVMLEAIAGANRNGKIAELTLVGASPEEQRYCNEYALRLGISDAVTTHGRVPGSRIPEFMSTADAGLCLWEDQPWWRFNPPTKLFEYLVAGLPVMASNIRTHTEYIKDGHNGLIFEYDSRSLADAITRLWANRVDIPSMKLRAAESGEKYLWQGIEPEFLAAAKGLQ